MKTSNYFYHEFMSIMQSKIPHKATLANTITTILDIDKDAAYRRLRGEVNFSFTEMAFIARKLGISLDEIVGIDTDRCQSIRLTLTKHINPTEADYAMFNDYINTMLLIKDEPDTKIIEGGNLLPHYLFFDYEYITRVFMFRWSQNSYDGKRLPFHEIIIPERMRKLQKQACFYARHIKSTIFVWDSVIFEHFVSSVKFYAHVRLIKEEDIDLIKKDLILLLNDIEKIAITGKYQDTGNAVSIYIGDIDADANLSYTESKNMCFTTYWAFLINAFSSFDGMFLDEIRSWLHSAQRFTTLISVSGDKMRTEFFNTQREIIDTL